MQVSWLADRSLIRLREATQAETAAAVHGAGRTGTRQPGRRHRFFGWSL